MMMYLTGSIKDTVRKFLKKANTFPPILLKLIQLKLFQRFVLKQTVAKLKTKNANRVQNKIFPVISLKTHDCIIFDVQKR